MREAMQQKRQVVKPAFLHSSVLPISCRIRNQATETPLRSERLLGWVIPPLLLLPLLVRAWVLLQPVQQVWFNQGAALQGLAVR